MSFTDSYNFAFRLTHGDRLRNDAVDLTGAGAVAITNDTGALSTTGDNSFTIPAAAGSLPAGSYTYLGGFGWSAGSARFAGSTQSWAAGSGIVVTNGTDTFLLTDDSRPFTSGGNGSTLTVTADPTVVTPVCFLPGTLIATPGGEVAIEDLRPGDLVLTAEGEAVPVRWIGQQTIHSRFAPHALPIRIGAGALGGGLPRRDLCVSPGHAMLVDGILVNAGAMVNGTTITRMSRMERVFVYLHVELDAHRLILAEGAPAESFLDNGDRARFDNGAEAAARGGATGGMQELPLPRAVSARQVPKALRARLDAVALDLLGPVAAAA